MREDKPVPFCKVCEHFHVKECHYPVEEYTITGTKSHWCKCKGEE